MNELEREVKIIFLNEAEQLLEEGEEHCLALAATSSDKEVGALFRVFHTFKGSSSSVGFLSLAEVVGHLENLLQNLRDGKITFTENVCKIFLDTVDFLRSSIQKLKSDLNCNILPEEMIARIKNTEQEALQIPTSKEPSLPAEQSSTPFFQGEQIPEFDESSGFREEPQEKLIRVSSRKLDTLINLIGELVVNQSILTAHQEKPGLQLSVRESPVEYMIDLCNEVYELSMSLRMTPIRQIFQRMNRLVIDLGLSEKKEIEFICSGEDIELDKAVIEKLSEPLIHLIRNAVDHGIEDSEQRLAVGKSAKARITLTAELLEDFALIKISDDGRGLNKENIIKKGIEQGLLNSKTTIDEISDSEAFALIFQPGFSTKERITEISGRGVGMDVVERVMNEVHGSIEIQTKEGVGTTFNLKFPLTLSVIHGLVVTVDQCSYVIPITQVIETVRCDANGRVLVLRGESIPVFKLGEILHGEMDRTHYSGTKLGVVILFRGKKVLFEIDSIVSQRPLTLKPIGPEVQRIRGISAGTILDNGEPALVLNLESLIPEKFPTDTVPKEAFQR